LTLASVPVPLLDSTTQVCWKSDNPSLPDTTLTPPRAVGATRSKPEQRKLLRYAGFASPCNPLQPLSDHSQLAGRSFEFARCSTAQSGSALFQHPYGSTRCEHLHASVESSWSPLPKASGRSRTHETTSWCGAHQTNPSSARSRSSSNTRRIISKRSSCSSRNGWNTRVRCPPSRTTP
jgi:hypothetical protein